MKLQRYDLKIVYVPGKLMFIADALSRAYLQDSSDSLIDDELDVSLIQSQLPMTPAKLAEFKYATVKKETLRTLSTVVMSGWPDRKELLPDGIQLYWDYRDEITMIDGLLFKSERVIVPQSLQREMEKLHEAHLGVVKTKRRARDIMFWSNMNNDIEQFISNCGVCNKFRKANNKEPLTPHDTPSRPWMKLGADVMEFKGKHDLLCLFTDLFYDIN
ncbi:uncharacterized protein K02A2.6-like [Ostrea edulis]|uniref:uncharacterized protein K02A2.6-like n=1 Tax=Ostrea edulis TaxID=37623 RepID=UPI0024AFBC6E|nr:uncharacterized protein K02A2.6-like [Ostrea edulis]